MLSFLNTAIGFAAVFALFSLAVTALAQVVRTVARMKNRYLVESLLRLFGELADSRRFVAALLAHPSLEGERGARLYRVLTDPRRSGDDPEVKVAVDRVIGPPRCGSTVAAVRRALRLPFPATTDLDGEAVRAIATTVYARIGPLVDSEVAAGGGRDSFPWAEPVLEALGAAEIATPGVVPFRGRMWALATAARPAEQGKADPVDTYVTAFHGEAQASASDDFTIAMRVTATAVAALVVVLFNLDALRLWSELSRTDPARVEALASSVQALAPGDPGAGDAALEANLVAAAEAVAAAARGPVQLRFLGRPLSTDGEMAVAQPWLTWAGLPGNLLALLALSFGAPFWFEVLKSAIGLKSAFSGRGGER